MLKIKTEGGTQQMYCWNTEGIFRLIQSIPSPKAEPFKRWLAKVGYERVQEIEDPELAQKRARAIYKAKGYPDDWIELRMRGIEIREQLTDEWNKHGVKAGKEYEILTAEICRATFGMIPSEYKKYKGLKRENLLPKEVGVSQAKRAKNSRLKPVVRSPLVPIICQPKRKRKLHNHSLILGKVCQRNIAGADRCKYSSKIRVYEKIKLSTSSELNNFFSCGIRSRIWLFSR